MCAIESSCVLDITNKNQVAWFVREAQKYTTYMVDWLWLLQLPDISNTEMKIHCIRIYNK